MRGIDPRTSRMLGGRSTIGATALRRQMTKKSREYVAMFHLF